MDDLKVTNCNIAVLIPDPDNARRHPEPNKEAIKRSIQRFGVRRPIVASEDTKIVYAGNGVLDAALDLGLEQIPVAWIPSGTPVEVCKAYALADNRTAELAEWDVEQLDKILSDIPDIDLADIGFDETSIDELLADLRINDIDETFDMEEAIENSDELLKKWNIEDGAMFRVGRHLLLCGDSCDKNVVFNLLNGQWVELICTDPPFDCTAEKVIDTFDIWGERVICLSAQKQAFSLFLNDWEFHLDLIWQHRTPRSIPSKHLPVFYHNNIILLSKKGVVTGWTRPTPSFGSIITLDDKDYYDNDNGYGYGKSHKLFVEMLKGFDFEVIGDPFLGSGASLIACEALGKSLFGMEIRKEVVGVCLERCASFGLDVVPI